MLNIEDFKDEMIEKDGSALSLCLSHAVITYMFTGIVADIWFF